MFKSFKGHHDVPASENNQLSKQRGHIFRGWSWNVGKINIADGLDASLRCRSFKT